MGTDKTKTFLTTTGDKTMEKEQDGRMVRAHVDGWMDDLRDMDRTSFLLLHFIAQHARCRARINSRGWDAHCAHLFSRAAHACATSALPTPYLPHASRARRRYWRHYLRAPPGTFTIRPRALPAILICAHLLSRAQPLLYAPLRTRLPLLAFPRLPPHALRTHWLYCCRAVRAAIRAHNTLHAPHAASGMRITRAPRTRARSRAHAFHYARARAHAHCAPRACAHHLLRAPRTCYRALLHYHMPSHHRCLPPLPPATYRLPAPAAVHTAARFLLAYLLIYAAIRILSLPAHLQHLHTSALHTIITCLSHYPLPAYWFGLDMVWMVGRMVVFAWA